jgi:hypothetical protein
MRTNDLVKAILKIVELRGLEPLTFSLRRLLLQLEQSSAHVQAVANDAQRARASQVGSTGGTQDDRFHAIDSRPVWWTGPEAGDW